MSHLGLAAGATVGRGSPLSTWVCEGPCATPPRLGHSPLRAHGAQRHQPPGSQEQGLEKLLNPQPLQSACAAHKPTRIKRSGSRQGPDNALLRGKKRNNSKFCAGFFFNTQPRPRGGSPACHAFVGRLFAITGTSRKPAVLHATNTSGDDAAMDAARNPWCIPSVLARQARGVPSPEEGPSATAHLKHVLSHARSLAFTHNFLHPQSAAGPGLVPLWDLRYSSAVMPSLWRSLT